MKKWGIAGVVVFGLFIAGAVLWIGPLKQKDLISPLGKALLEKPLDKYTFEALRQRKYYPSEIKVGQKIKENVWTFYFDSDGKKVSGVINLPAKVSTISAFLDNKVVIMLHGFASQQEYYPGFGTEKVAAVLARNGYVTLAPDGLGYGSSDNPSMDVFEERFQTYTTTLNLMATVKPFGIWAHSNGGQIALSVLEISGQKLPTILWNPVSKHFPYNILFYTDQFDDQGKALRKNLAEFEKSYDVDKYDTAKYLDWIAAPILLQQGELDDQVSKKWSDDLAKKLKDVTYKVYPGSDHNLMPMWNTAVSDALNFFNSAK